MKAWFSPEPSRLDIMRQITQGSTPRLRVIYATADRELTHLWGDNDALALEAQEQNSNVIQMRGNR